MDATVLQAVAEFGDDERAGDARLSDLASAGAAGSHQVRLTEGLLADAETRVIYGQPPSEVDHARELLGLSDTEAKLLPHLPRGQARWKVGTRSFLVDHRLSGAEVGFVDTDSRMTPRLATVNAVADSNAVATEGPGR